MIYYEDDEITLYHGDCIETMKEIEENSIDAVVCDPPYAISFMGKKFDTFPVRGLSGRDVERGEGQDGLTARRRNKPESYNAGLPFQQWCQEWATEAEWDSDEIPIGTMETGPLGDSGLQIWGGENLVEAMKHGEDWKPTPLQGTEVNPKREGPQYKDFVEFKPCDTKTKRLDEDGNEIKYSAVITTTVKGNPNFNDEDWYRDPEYKPPVDEKRVTYDGTAGSEYKDFIKPGDSAIRLKSGAGFDATVPTGPDGSVSFELPLDARCPVISEPEYIPSIVTDHPGYWEWLDGEWRAIPAEPKPIPEPGITDFSDHLGNAIYNPLSLKEMFERDRPECSWGCALSWLGDLRKWWKGEAA
jgi:hypothetical protein